MLRVTFPSPLSSIFSLPGQFCHTQACHKQSTGNSPHFPVMGNALFRHPLRLSEETAKTWSVLSCLRQLAPSPLILYPMTSCLFSDSQMRCIVGLQHLDSALPSMPGGKPRVKLARNKVAPNFSQSSHLFLPSSLPFPPSFPLKKPSWNNSSGQHLVSTYCVQVCC